MLATGTHHFDTFESAVAYYRHYGETVESLKEKLTAGDIAIGKPEDGPGVYHTLDRTEGRYIAHTVMTRAQYMGWKEIPGNPYPDTKEGRAKRHHDYMIQFATNATRATVARVIGEQRIKNSRDPHFNDIPLREWDALSNPTILAINRKAKIAANEFPNSDPTKLYWSLSDGVCIAKACARELRPVQTKGKLKEKTGVTFQGQGVTFDKGTHVQLIKGASGTQGDLWAIESADLVAELTGNAHDAEYRYCFVPVDSVDLD
jgi:hypothetical protein